MIGKTIKFTDVRHNIVTGVVVDKFMAEKTIMRSGIDTVVVVDYYLVKVDDGLEQIKCNKIIDVI